MAADKSISDIDLAEFQTPNRRASGLIKGAEAFHRISDEPEPEDAYMPALGLSPIKEYVEGKSGMLSIPDPKKIFTICLDMIGGEDAVVTSILNGTFQESVHQCMAKYADEDTEGARQELNQEQCLKVSEFIGRTMIRFLIGELNINCSGRVMAVPSKVSTSIRVLSVSMAELNPILKNKRDAERQLKNFEDKLVLKNSNSDIMRRMANDTATMEDFEALIDGTASAQMKQIEKVRAVLKQNIKAADVALAAADRKNATQAITVNLDGKVAISDLLDSSALVLDVKSLLGRPSPKVALKFERALATLYNANPGKFPISRLITDTIFSEAKIMNSKYGVPLIADGMADRERILNDDAKYLLRRETNMLQNIIDTKYNKLSETVQTQLVTVRTNTAGEKQIMAEEDNGLSLINVLALTHLDDLPAFRAEIKSLIEGFPNKVALGNHGKILQPFMDTILRSALEHEIQVEYYIAVHPILTMLKSKPGSHYISIIEKFERPTDAESHDCTSMLMKLCSELKRIATVDRIEFPASASHVSDATKFSRDYSAFVARVGIESDKSLASVSNGVAKPAQNDGAGGDGNNDEKGKSDADRVNSNKKANDTVRTLQPIGQWAKWECAGADCDNKILPADRPTPSDAMTKVLEKCEEFRKKNPDDTKLYRPMVCLNCLKKCKDGPMKLKTGKTKPKTKGKSGGAKGPPPAANTVDEAEPQPEAGPSEAEIENEKLKAELKEAKAQIASRVQSAKSTLWGNDRGSSSF
jgi:hypothetical protein